MISHTLIPGISVEVSAVETSKTTIVALIITQNPTQLSALTLKPSSSAMMSSTVSNESAPRSWVKDAVGTTWLSSTANCWATIVRTFDRTSPLSPPMRSGDMRCCRATDEEATHRLPVVPREKQLRGGITKAALRRTGKGLEEVGRGESMRGGARQVRGNRWSYKGKLRRRQAWVMVVVVVGCVGG